jgi:molybdopterin-guanine dinucleotide biosynthesis protein A
LPSIRIGDITGLVLAGGRGSRMGGSDKGLQAHLGVPLALHALRRLAPQVGIAAINANRNLSEYESMGIPVWPDEIPAYPGPLAGVLAGLARCETPYLATVPCDTPNFPLDLVERLANGLIDAGGEMAMAFTREGGVPRGQPVFSLMSASVRDSALAYVRSGGASVGAWAGARRCARVIFEDAGAFFNANTPADLAQLQAGER